MAITSLGWRLGLRSIGTSPNAPFAITADLARNFYAVQFHPEVHHTPRRRASFMKISCGMAGFRG